MARKREQNITESGAELRELAERYAGKAQEGRLLFLAWLKETPGSTIGQAARAAGLSERQGRYLWDDYCAGGVERVIGRRVYQPKGEKKPVRSASVPAAGTVAGMTAADMVRFMNAVGELGRIDDSYKWARRLGDLLMEFVPEVDYAVVQVRHNLTQNFGSFSTDIIYNIHPDGRMIPGLETTWYSHMKNRYEAIIEQGRLNGFPYDDYHFPPFGLDLHTDSFTQDLPDVRIFVGSLLLFRKVTNSTFSPEFYDLFENLKPWLVLVFTEFILRLSRIKPSRNLFPRAVDRVVGKVGLSLRESQILLLLLAGHTHDEIADLLNVTRSTVNKHTRSVFRKAGVRRLSEFFARYFTPRDHFPEQENRETDPDSEMGE